MRRSDVCDGSRAPGGWTGRWMTGPPSSMPFGPVARAGISRMRPRTWLYWSNVIYFLFFCFWKICSSWQLTNHDFLTSPSLASKLLTINNHSGRYDRLLAKTMKIYYKIFVLVHLPAGGRKGRQRWTSIILCTYCAKVFSGYYRREF